MKEQFYTLVELITIYYDEFNEETLNDFMSHSSYRTLWREGTAIWNNVHQNLRTPAKIEWFVSDEGKKSIQLDYIYFYFSVDVSECGRNHRPSGFKSGKRIFYHGTSKENLGKIVMEGILFGLDAKGKRVTYLTTMLDEAMYYGDTVLRVLYDPADCPDMNNYDDDAWAFRVYEPISVMDTAPISQEDIDKYNNWRRLSSEHRKYIWSIYDDKNHPLYPERRMMILDMFGMDILSSDEPPYTSVYPEWMISDIYKLSQAIVSGEIDDEHKDMAKGLIKTLNKYKSGNCFEINGK